jgi:hypothetical protein
MMSRIHFSTSTVSVGLALISVLFTTSGCGNRKVVSVPPSDPRIIGIWTAEGGDYPLTNEYRADGTLVQRSGDRATPPYPFRIEGKFLILPIERAKGEVFEQKEEYTISGDTLTIIHSPESKSVFQRNKGE